MLAFVLLIISCREIARMLVKVCNFFFLLPLHFFSSTLVEKSKFNFPKELKLGFEMDC